MPELPDVVVYMEAIGARVRARTLERVRIQHPFLLRSVEPGARELEGKRLVELRRLGKRIALGFQEDLWAVLHLMIAGRLHWRDPGGKLHRRRDLAAFDFEHGSLVMTEAGTKRRASLYIVRGEEALAGHDPGGLEVIDADMESFSQTLTRRSHTLKRALTDPRLFSGIGNAYSDEILHRARLSPVTLTQRLTDEEVGRLYEATRAVLAHWIQRLREDSGGGFPERVTAFRPEMAVHGRYGEPCPRCGSPVQRIRYASNETNYCPTCQTGGKILADRVLSRLLGKDWPRTLEELEEMKGGGGS
jgi:formamidopyrimidine-DNA glycosylase